MMKLLEVGHYDGLALIWVGEKQAVERVEPVGKSATQRQLWHGRT